MSSMASMLEGRGHRGKKGAGEQLGGEGVESMGRQLFQESWS